MTSLYGCVVTATQSQVAATWIQENSDATAVTSAGPVTVIAEPIYMVWHESDTALHIESDANSLRAAMGMLLPASTSSAIVTPTVMIQYGTTSPNRIPQGAVAGIAVGFVACFVAIGVLVYFALKRRKQMKKSAADRPGAEGSPATSDFWRNREVYGGPLHLQTSTTLHNSPSCVDLHPAESIGSRTPQSPYMSQTASRAKMEDMFAVEQKMLIR